MQAALSPPYRFLALAIMPSAALQLSASPRAAMRLNADCPLQPAKRAPGAPQTMRAGRRMSRWRNGRLAAAAGGRSPPPEEELPPGSPMEPLLDFPFVAMWAAGWPGIGWALSASQVRQGSGP